MFTEAISASGVAEATGVRQTSSTVQVSLKGASGSGTVTVSAIPSGQDTYEDITDGTISVSAPTTLIFDGYVRAIKATSDNSGDSFTLQVVA